jgi:F-type H+-transporting ATPase subunit b
MRSVLTIPGLVMIGGACVAEVQAAAPEGHAGPSYGLLTVDGMTAVWTILVFLLLLLILRLMAWKPIVGALAAREKFITDSLAAAKREREAANVLLADYTRRIETARSEASAIVEEGRRDAESVKHRIEEEARKEADKMVDRAKREISIATETAVKHLYEATARLATDAASKIIRKEMKADDHKRLIEESIAELAKLSRN